MGIERNLFGGGRLWGLLLRLGTIALCAFILAWAVGTYLAADVKMDAPPTQRPVAADAPPSAVPGAQNGRGIGTIVDRNIFCSTCAPATPAPAHEAPLAVLDVGHLQLVATLVSEEDATWSFAAIRDGNSGEVGLFGVGSRLRGGPTVRHVAEREVELVQQQQTAVLRLLPENPAGPAPRLTAIRGRGLSDQLRAGIREVGPGRYEIDRGALRHALANSTQLARWGRIVPRSDGKGGAAGFGLYRIHPDSLYALLGLRDGDSVQAVNGRPLTPEIALTLYSKLQVMNHMTVSLVRRGKNLTHDYTIIQ